MHSVQDESAAAETDHRVRWWRSLPTRLVLWSSAASIAFVLTVATVFYLGQREVLIDSARDSVHTLAQQSARGLGARLDSLQVSAHTLAASAAAIGREQVGLRALLTAMATSDPNIVGAMMIIEPGRLREDDPGFSWYVRRNAKGLQESSLESMGYDYRVMDWYVRTITTDAPWWSEPYANAATGGIATTTYYLALRLPGNNGGPERTIGTISLDMPMSRLLSQLGEQPMDARLRATLLSPKRLLISHADAPPLPPQTLDARVAAGAADLRPLLAGLRGLREIEFEHTTVLVPRLLPAAEPPQQHFGIGLPVGDTGWAFVLSASEGYVLEQLDRITLRVLLTGVVGALLGVVVVWRMSVLIAKPIGDLTNYVRHVALGEFDYPVPQVRRLDEVGVMARAFDSARHSIKAQLRVIAQMGVVQARRDGELEVASDIQLAMLPHASEFGAGGVHLGLHGLLVPAKTVAGDFYSFFERDGDVLWFAIGDVSGKGVPAALFMARTITVLEVAAQADGSPGHALREAAKHLFESNDTCMFATVLCGVIELRTGVMTLASAAHESPVLLRADGTRELLKLPTAPPLGVEVAENYPMWRGRLHPGDTLLTYTDGITEAFDAQNNGYGTQRLLDALDPALDPKRQCEALVDHVRAFAGDAEQSDDIAVLSMRFRLDVPTAETFSMRVALAPPLPKYPVRELIAQIDAGLSEHRLPATLVHDVHLVIEEVVSNVLSHSNSGPRQPSLELIATVAGSQLLLKFKDDAPAFDPLSLAPPNLDSAIDDRPIGGLGVYLVRELAEDVAYTRTRDFNVLRVVLLIPQPEPKT